MKEKSISFIRLSVIEEDQKTVRAKQGEVEKTAAPFFVSTI